MIKPVKPEQLAADSVAADSADSAVNSANPAKFRIFISTGEVSGDLQGSWLIKALQTQGILMGKELEIFALGGDRMAAAGATLWANTTTIGSVGVLESLPYIWPTWQIQKQTQQYLQATPPDLVILIDYLGPNLRLGNYIRQHFPQVPIVYYIAPQEWVWSFDKKTTTQIVRICDRILAIFPQEARYYQEKGAEVTWVGHPLVDQMQGWIDRASARESLGIDPQAKAIALLPASRRQEIKYLLPVMLAAARQIQDRIPNVQFYIPLSNSVYRQDIERAIAQFGLQATVVEGEQNHRYIAAADLAITKSGTVNLEIALLNVPQVTIYRLNPITAWILRTVFKFSIPFMSPTNLVLMKPIVPELLQEQVTPANIVRESLQLLQNHEKRQQVLLNYQKMRQALGGRGAGDRAAKSILAVLTKDNCRY